MFLNPWTFKDHCEYWQIASTLWAEAYTSRTDIDLLPVDSQLLTAVSVEVACFLNRLFLFFYNIIATDKTKLWIYMCVSFLFLKTP